MFHYLRTWPYITKFRYLDLWFLLALKCSTKIRKQEIYTDSIVFYTILYKQVAVFALTQKLLKVWCFVRLLSFPFKWNDNLNMQRKKATPSLWEMYAYQVWHERRLDLASHQPGTLWVTEGLTVPMATTSSFSKVKDSPSSHPVAREWRIFLGLTLLRLALEEKEGKWAQWRWRDGVYIKPSGGKKNKKKQAGTCGKSVSHQ